VSCPRSNEFQRLVFLVKRLLSPSGASVTESKLLIDRETGDAREVDVCVETEISGHQVTLCFECRDHKRLADVIWVEQMLAKHQRLATNTLVLVSRSGFSKSARTLARLKGIDLLVYSKLTEEDLKRVVGLSGELWITFWELRVERVTGTIPALDDLPSERVRFVDDHYVLNHEGKRLGITSVDR
jgi:hypothetical protein